MEKARVVQEHKTSYVLSGKAQEYVATVRGSFFVGDAFPKVGDWVHYTVVADGKAVIEEVLPRTSSIVRKAAGAEGNQVVVTNVDVMFIVMGLDGDFNLSRLERYLLLASQSVVQPVIVLNKMDAVSNVQEYVESVKVMAHKTPIHTVSALSGQNMDDLLAYFNGETVVVLLGSSGAGKSTITNWLLNEEKQSTAAVRVDDSRGVHTTTSKQLFVVPAGGYLIDTPGMRELGVVDTSAEDEKAVFARIEELSTQCRYPNCDHIKSDGCAVLLACSTDPEFARQVQNYQKLQGERLVKEEKYKKEMDRQQKRIRRNK